MQWIRVFGTVFRMDALVTLLLATLMSSVTAQFVPNRFPAFNDINKEFHKREASYFVLASRMVRPGQVYRVSVLISRSMLPITVRASIQRNGVQVASAQLDCKEKIPEILLLKVPPTSVPGVYRLRVEGNVNGVLGGTAFLNETHLEFSQHSMTIVIQTDHPIYKQGQTVRFRAMPITTELKAFPEAVDVYMLDPNNTIMKRWLSRQTNMGAVSLEYHLSEQPVYGTWTVRVIAQGQIEEKTFLVEEYYQTRYEVNVTMPGFVQDMDEYIEGTVEANYTSGTPVIGNLTLQATIEPLQPHYRVQGRPPVVKNVFEWFEGFTKFRFAMSDLEKLIPQLHRSKVTVTAYVGERFLDIIQSGFAQALIFSSNIKLQFLGSSPQVFKPAMTFKTYVALSYQDGSSLPSWRLIDQKIQITPTIYFHNSGSRRLPTRYEKMSSTTLGLWEFNIDLLSEFGKKEILNDVKFMTLQAYYTDDTRESARTELKVYATYSVSQRHIQVTTSTKAPKVGEYVIFHVRADYYVERFSYVILSKGIILLTDQEEMTSSIKTFAVTLSAEMAPTSTVVVYSTVREGEVVADSLTFTVDGISKNNFTLALNNRKDKSGDTVEVIIEGRPSTYVGLLAVDKALFDMHGGSDLTYTEVLRKMGMFDEGKNGTLTHVWLSKDGVPEKISNFPSPSYGIDSNRTFEYAGLLVFTDAYVPKRPEFCNISQGLLTCIDGSCYGIEKRCDGFKDCPDGLDESNCPERNPIPLEHFRHNRINRIQRLYNNSWLWHDINIGPLGHYIFNVPVPDIPTNWIITAFGMNNVDGFGVLRNPLQFSSARPFYMKVEMPTKCKQGEQVGIRVSVFNYMLFEMEVLIALASSPEYKFVHVESLGYVEAYAPRTSFGEHQHLVFIKPGKTIEVYMPIVPTRLGDITITIVAKTQVAKDRVTRHLLVEPDGITQYRHISVQLDLSQGAYLIKYLSTNVTDTPIVPFRQERLYMFGSNKATISVSGDVIGPIFPTMPVNASSLLRKPFWCGEQNMFNFAINLYMLLYLRLSGQRQIDIEKQAFKYLNIGYQRQLSYQREDGAFVPFVSNDQPSVWLTAFCARVFYKATFQEWENFLYIDNKVISKAVDWLLRHQSSEGAFYETTAQPLDRKIYLSANRLYDNVKYRNISLTAHVLITLSELKDISGEIGSRISNARRQARRYLEKMLYIMREFQDPYEVAIVTYALTLSSSPEGDDAFNLLDTIMRVESGLRYWAIERVPSQPVTIENNKPFLKPRLPYKYDSSNVEATAYGLLVHVARQAVIQREIVEWLNMQRLTDGGWASTQDTAIALEALIAYAVQSQIREVTDLTVSVETLATAGDVKKFHIAQSNLVQQQLLEIPNAWGVVVVKAQGSGVALVQMSVQYNVDWPQFQTAPPVDAFALHVRTYSYGRNSSRINFNSCQRWTYTDESPTSGMAVLEVEVPTGYFVQQQELDKYVRSGGVRNLREGRYSERKVVFYFDYLDTLPICVSLTVWRWNPVANLTRWIAVKVYDYYAPERFNETMIDMYGLYVLSICQVCGSYQCPYCPVFSWAATVSCSYTLLVVSVLWTMYRFSIT